MKLQISRLNHIGQFGSMQSETAMTISGTKQHFVPKQEVHYANYQRSLTQQYQLQGTELAGTIVIAVRSQNKVADDFTHAKLEDGLYRVVSISRDMSHSLTRYDLITLRKVKKV